MGVGWGGCNEGEDKEASELLPRNRTHTQPTIQPTHQHRDRYTYRSCDLHLKLQMRCFCCALVEISKGQNRTKVVAGGLECRKHNTKLAPTTTSPPHPPGPFKGGTRT